jgi:hypothetical protein
MAKKTGTKHHVPIRMEDLNKMFKASDVILVPKSFIRSIEFLLCAHNVSLNETPKDSDDIAEIAEALQESSVQVTETNFEE